MREQGAVLELRVNQDDIRAAAGSDWRVAGAAIEGGQDVRATGTPLEVERAMLFRQPRIGVARRLFDFDNAVLSLQCSPMRCYEVSDDGMSFYANRSVHPPRPRPIVTDIALVQNWFEELKAKVPSK